MKRFALLLITLFFLTVQSLPAAELTILTENLPPLNYLKDGKLIGPSVEIVQEIQKRVGSTAEIKVLPWSRAYKIALKDENVILFGTTQTESRKDTFKWAGALSTKKDILLARKDSGITLSSLEDARKVTRIGTLRDDTREQLLQSHGFTNLESVSDEQKNAKKLAMGRIDLWAYKKPGYRKVCELAGIDHTLFEEVFHLREIDVSIAFSKQTPDTTVERWRRAYNELLTDGTIKKIRDSWGVE